MPTHEQTPSSGMRVIYALTTFASATLLFAVQPLAGRFLLPYFGGTPAVWVTCLAFFQLALLCGYLWVHWLCRWLPARGQMLVQLVLALAAIAATPLALPTPTGTSDTSAPAAAILGYLATHVGLGYFVLASTAPLLQRWYAAAQAREPYTLYAISNVGSLFGLLSYPFWVEPNLDLVDQARVWSGAFIGYTLLLGVAALAALPGTARATSGERAPWPSLPRAVSWVALAAAPSALLSAVSNHITEDVAASPLLWIVPLSLYLITFILAFRGTHAHRPQLQLGLWIACTVALPILLLPGNQARLGVTLAIPLLTLFVGCLLAHTELARTRPPHSQLTAYYVCMSAGGALGTAFVGFVAPLLFEDHYELPLSMLAIHAIVLVRALRMRRGSAPSGEQRLAWLGFGLALPVLCATVLAQVAGYGHDGRVIARYRSFFGPLQVAELARTRVLTHGRTQHGAQLRDPLHRQEPIAYFGPETGVGRALRMHHRGRARRIGVLGLGVGALAAYAQPSDTLIYYEINPDMLRAARRYFSYLRDTRASLSVLLGDGRISLARATSQHFDVLVLDAFSSDSVPTHLLTTEAFGIYVRHLAPDGLLLANVSNRHLRVERAVVAAARAHGLHAIVTESPSDAARSLARVRWALMSRDAAELDSLLTPSMTELAVPSPVLFTDRRSSLWSIIGSPSPARDTR